MLSWELTLIGRDELAKAVIQGCSEIFCKIVRKALVTDYILQIYILRIILFLIF